MYTSYCPDTASGVAYIGSSCSCLSLGRKDRGSMMALGCAQALQTPAGCAPLPTPLQHCKLQEELAESERLSGNEAPSLRNHQDDHAAG